MYEPILLYLWLLLNYDIHQFFHSMVFDVLIQIALSYFLSTLIRVFQRFRSGNAPFLLPLSPFLLPLFLQYFLSGRGSARSSSPLYLLILWTKDISYRGGKIICHIFSIRYGFNSSSTVLFSV